MPSLFYKQKKALVEKWTHQHGYICPGHQRPAHKAHPRYNPLTVDHIRPRSRGGTNDLTNLQILCRNCNSSKKNRPANPVPTGPTYPHPLRNR